MSKKRTTISFRDLFKESIAVGQQIGSHIKKYRPIRPNNGATGVKASIIKYSTKKQYSIRSSLFCFCCINRITKTIIYDTTVERPNLVVYCSPKLLSYFSNALVLIKSCRYSPKKSASKKPPTIKRIPSEKATTLCNLISLMNPIKQNG